MALRTFIYMSRACARARRRMDIKDKNMRKVLLSLLFIMLCQVSVMAQSTMTDAQIIDFIQKEQAAGTSQQQISIKLVQKGVSVQRLQELRKKYEKL